MKVLFLIFAEFLFKENKLQRYFLELGYFENGGEKYEKLYVYLCEYFDTWQKPWYFFLFHIKTFDFDVLKMHCLKSTLSVTIQVKIFFIFHTLFIKTFIFIIITKTILSQLYI